MSRRFLRTPICRPRLALGLLALLAMGMSACADRPDLSGRVAPADPRLPWPELVSLASLSQDQAIEAQGDTTAERLAARAGALRSRGRRMASTPVLSRTDRQRLLAAIARHSAGQ